MMINNGIEKIKEMEIGNEGRIGTNLSEVVEKLSWGVTADKEILNNSVMTKSFLMDDMFLNNKIYVYLYRNEGKIIAETIIYSNSNDTYNCVYLILDNVDTEIDDDIKALYDGIASITEKNLNGKEIIINDRVYEIDADISCGEYQVVDIFTKNIIFNDRKMMTEIELVEKIFDEGCIRKDKEVDEMTELFEVVEAAEDILLNGESLDIMLDIIHDVVFNTGDLRAYEVWENDEYFFNEYYSDKPYELMEAIVDGDYRKRDDFVGKDDAFGTLKSWDKRSLKEEYGENFKEIFDKIVECYQRYEIPSAPDQIVELIEKYMDIQMH